MSLLPVLVLHYCRYHRDTVSLLLCRSAAASPRRRRQDKMDEGDAKAEADGVKEEDDDDVKEEDDEASDWSG